MATLNPPHVGPADHVSVRLDYDTMRQLRALSARRQVSISDVVRGIVCEHLGAPPPKPRTTRTLNRLERTDELVRAGVGVIEACASTGLDPGTWYRHTRQAKDDNVAADVLAVLTAIRDAVAN